MAKDETDENGEDKECALMLLAGYLLKIYLLRPNKYDVNNDKIYMLHAINDKIVCETLVPQPLQLLHIDFLSLLRDGDGDGVLYVKVRQTLRREWVSDFVQEQYTIVVVALVHCKRKIPNHISISETHHQQMEINISLPLSLSLSQQQRGISNGQ